MHKILNNHHSLLWGMARLACITVLGVTLQLKGYFIVVGTSGSGDPPGMCFNYTYGDVKAASETCESSGQCYESGLVPALEQFVYWACSSDKFQGFAYTYAELDGTSVVGESYALGDSRNVYYPGTVACDVNSYSRCDGTRYREPDCHFACE
jgi:hypothetical protein